MRGSAPSSSSLQQQHSTADFSSSWDAISIAAISYSERVLHLPCARIGALILIIYCTHIYILRLIKWLSVLVFYVYLLHILVPAFFLYSCMFVFLCITIYFPLGILQWYQSIVLAQPVELAIYGKYEDHNAYILT